MKALLSDCNIIEFMHKLTMTRHYGKTLLEKCRFNIMVILEAVGCGAVADVDNILSTPFTVY